MKNYQKADPEKRFRIYYGPFRIRCDKRTIGRMHVNLLKRKSLRANVNLEIFDKGRFPWFHGGEIIAEGTSVLPLAAIQHLMIEVDKTGVRVRKNEAHKWYIKKYVRKAKDNAKKI